MDNYSLDGVYSALGDPTRRAVVHRLAGGAATVGELAEPFAMALPSFLKHIRVLEASGLVQSRKSGRVRTCELRPQTLTAAQQWIADQQALWDARSDRMTQYVETLHQSESRHAR